MGQVPMAFEICVMGAFPYNLEIRLFNFINFSPGSSQQIYSNTGQLHDRTTDERPQIGQIHGIIYNIQYTVYNRHIIYNTHIYIYIYIYTVHIA